jgi:hypothetical protein
VRWRRLRGGLQQPGAPPPRVGLCDGNEGGQVEEPQVVRLVHGALQRLFGENVGEIEQGSRDGRDRDAVLRGDVLGAQPAGAVDADAVATGATVLRGHGHVDDGGRAASNAPKRRGAGVREDRARPARQDGCEPVAVSPQLSVTDRVDAAVKAKKATRSHALVNPMRRQAACGELLTRQDAVLPVPQRSQTALDRG